MAQSISQNMQGLILGGVLLILVIAGGVYGDVVLAKPDDSTIQHVEYSTQVLDNEMQPKQVFDRITTLDPLPASQPDPAQPVDTNTLGKKDITKFD